MKNMSHYQTHLLIYLLFISTENKPVSLCAPNLISVFIFSTSAQFFFFLIERQSDSVSV